MGDPIKYWFNGQAGYEVGVGKLKKIRVVFGMIDEDETSMAWYVFTSNGVAKSKEELANPDDAQKQFGHRTEGGRKIPHTFTKKIKLDELAIKPKGTPAILTLEVTDSKRFLECRIDGLKTKEKEDASFPFGLQYDADPSSTGKIHGKVFFVELASYDEKKFPSGPQGKLPPDS